MVLSYRSHSFLSWQPYLSHHAFLLVWLSRKKCYQCVKCQKVFHGDFSVCVYYMQYILSYCSRFCPLSSLCSISRVGGGEGRGGALRMTGIPRKTAALWPHVWPPVPSLSAVLVKPVEVVEFRVWWPFCKNRTKKQQSPPLLWLCFLFCHCKPLLLVRSLLLFAVVWSYWQLLSRRLLSQRWKKKWWTTSSKVYGAMFSASEEFWDSKASREF